MLPRPHSSVAERCVSNLDAEVAVFDSGCGLVTHNSKSKEMTR